MTIDRHARNINAEKRRDKIAQRLMAFLSQVFPFFQSVPIISTILSLVFLNPDQKTYHTFIYA